MKKFNYYGNGCLITSKGAKVECNLDSFAQLLNNKGVLDGIGTYYVPKTLMRQLIHHCLMYSEDTPLRPFVTPNKDLLGFVLGRKQVKAIQQLYPKFKSRNAVKIKKAAEKFHSDYGDTTFNANSALLVELERSQEAKGIHLHRLIGVQEASLRPFYRGGRVDCVMTDFYYEGEVFAIDINSSYPNVAANYKHPYTSGYQEVSDVVSRQTRFVKWRGLSEGLVPHVDKFFNVNYEFRLGEFYTCIQEFKFGLKHNLIRVDEIVACYNFSLSSLATMNEYFEQTDLMKGIAEMLGTKQDRDFYKLQANIVIGKLATDPRGRKEWRAFHHKAKDFDGYELTYPEFKVNDELQFSLGVKPQVFHPYMFDKKLVNVSTAASINSQARVNLVDACLKIRDAGGTLLYCDTDCIFATKVPETIKLHPHKLGHWKTEAVGNRLYIQQGKHYCLLQDNKIVKDGNFGKTLKPKERRRIEGEPHYLAYKTTAGDQIVVDAGTSSDLLKKLNGDVSHLKLVDQRDKNRSTARRYYENMP